MGIRTQIQMEVPLDAERLTAADLGDVGQGFIMLLGTAAEVVMAVAGDKGRRVLTIEGTSERIL